jgi:hypothetical protein
MGASRVCLVCGTGFYAPPSVVARGWGKYCNFACAQIGRGRQRRISEAVRNRSRKTFGVAVPDPPLGPCWVWEGSIDHEGYGEIMVAGVDWRAHRLAWTTFVGPIAEGLTIDHLCRNRLCVNPRHMELVPLGENVRRGNGVPAHNARKEKCGHGHPFTEKNTYITPQGDRGCRTCRRAATRAHEERMRG